MKLLPLLQDSISRFFSTLLMQRFFQFRDQQTCIHCLQLGHVLGVRPLTCVVALLQLEVRCRQRQTAKIINQFLSNPGSPPCKTLSITGCFMSLDRPHCASCILYANISIIVGYSLHNCLLGFQHDQNASSDYAKDNQVVP